MVLSPMYSKRHAQRPSTCSTKRQRSSVNRNFVYPDRPADRCRLGGVSATNPVHTSFLEQREIICISFTSAKLVLTKL